MKSAILLFANFLTIWLVSNQTMNGQSLCEDFGQNGIAKATFSHETAFQAMAEQNDGKIIIVGVYNDEEIGAQMLAFRINPDGTPDLGFGDRGNTKIEISNDFHKAYSVVVTNDGYIFLGGGGTLGGFLAALTPTGNRYSSFGTNGVMGFGGGGPIWDLIADGNTIYGIHGGSTGFYLTGVNSNGQSVSGFGNNGSIFMPSTFNIYSLRSMQIGQLSDGKLITAFSTESATSPSILDNLILHRFLPDGTPDSIWGTNGMILEPESDGYNCKELIIDEDDKIIIGGFNIDPNPNLTTSIAHRFLPNGNSDGSFNGVGSSTHATSHRLHSMIQASNGTLYFVGKKELNNQNSFHIAAYKNDGNIDTDFGVVDWLGPDSDVLQGELNDFIQFSDGSFLAIGTISLTEGNTRGIAVRLNSDGTVQESWGEDGYFWGNTVQQAFATSIKETSDGSLVAVGTIGYTGANGAHSAPAIARFDPDGTPDHDFGFRGRVFQDAGPGFRFFHSLEVLPNDQLLAIGDATTSEGWVLARFDENGQPDSTFGSNGWMTKRIGCNNCYRESKKSTLDNNGNILLAGSAGFVHNSNLDDAVVVRLLPNGDVDTAFGNWGIARVDLTILDHGFNDLVALPNNSVLASGFIYFSDSLGVREDGLLVKLTSSGIIDSTFGTNGTWIWDSGNGIAEFEHIEILPSGNILLGGIYRGGNGLDDIRAMIIQLLPNGAFDPSFGVNGIAEVSYPNSKKHRFDGVSIDNNENYYLSGYFFANGFRTFVAKFDQSGKPDSLFANNGVYLYYSPTTNLNGAPTLLNDNRMILPGTAGNSEDFYLICTDLTPNTTAINPKLPPKNSLKIFPNPTNSTLTIQLPKNLQKEQMNLQITDLNGRIWIEQTIETQIKTNVEVSNLPIGIYTIMLSNSNKQFTGRFIKII